MLWLSDKKIKNVVFECVRRRMAIKHEKVAVGYADAAFEH